MTEYTGTWTIARVFESEGREFYDREDFEDYCREVLYEEFGGAARCDGELVITEKGDSA